MIGRLRQAGMLWPSLFCLVALPTLIALGNWQWSRMHWKAGLLKELAAATQAPPVALQDLLGSNIKSHQSIEAMRFRQVSVTGIFEHGSEFHVWAPGTKGPAWSVVTPLRISAAPGASASHTTHILVVRGVVPANRKAPEARPGGQPTAPQKIIGRLRLDQPNTWANAPNILKNEWFTRDLVAMKQHLAQSASATRSIAPVFLEAEQQQGDPTAPKPDLKSLTLSNRHLSYALTWWGLAATLLGVFGVYAWGRIKAAKS